jgi:hypothetical protein
MSNLQNNTITETDEIQSEHIKLFAKLKSEIDALKNSDLDDKLIFQKYKSYYILIASITDEYRDLLTDIIPRVKNIYLKKIQHQDYHNDANSADINDEELED